MAVTLLRKPATAQWVTDSFPLIVIDEFQDCVGSRLGVVTELSKISQIILALDEFQHLVGAGEQCPAFEWIESLVKTGDVIEYRLQKQHRTKEQGLLSATAALRKGCGSAT